MSAHLTAPTASAGRPTAAVFARLRPQTRWPAPTSREHRLARRGLLGILIAGALLRVLLMVAWRPAFMGWPDAKSYLDVAHAQLFSSTLRPAGYPLFLRLLEGLVPDIRFVILVNHGLGLASAVLLYLAVARAGGPRLLGLLPAAVVALGGDGIFLEHSTLSEPLFTFLVCVGVYAGARMLAGEGSEGSLRWPALLGLALAASATVRVVGVAMLPVLGAWVLFAAGGGWRRRATSLAVAAVAAGAVLGSYYVAEYRAVGDVGLSRHGMWHLYGRVAPFADCSRFTPPAGTEALCQPGPRSTRPITDAYIFNWWYSPAIRRFGYVFASTPYGTAKIGQFARAVIIHQPLDYLGEVSWSMLRYVAPGSLRGYGGGPTYAELAGPILFNPLFEYQGLDSVRQDYGWHSKRFLFHRHLLGALKGWEVITRIQGPLMALLALLSFVAPFVTRGRARSAALLFMLSAWTLLTVPVATLEFSARSAVPGFGPLGAAAAVGGWGVLMRFRAWRGARGPGRRRGASQPA